MTTATAERTDYAALRGHLKAVHPWLDPMAWLLLDDAENEAADLRAENERLRAALTSVAVTHCREWCDDKINHCGARAEFLIWGKLIPPNGLGPRCYDHAAEHVGHRALGDPSWAIVDMRPALRALAAEGE